MKKNYSLWEQLKNIQYRDVLLSVFWAVLVMIFTFPFFIESLITGQDNAFVSSFFSGLISFSKKFDVVFLNIFVLVLYYYDVRICNKQVQTKEFKHSVFKLITYGVFLSLMIWILSSGFLSSQGLRPFVVSQKLIYLFWFCIFVIYVRLKYASLSINESYIITTSKISKDTLSKINNLQYDNH